MKTVGTDSVGSTIRSCNIVSSLISDGEVVLMVIRPSRWMVSLWSIGALGVLVGFSWEHSFDGGVEASFSRAITAGALRGRLCFSELRGAQEGAPGGPQGGPQEDPSTVSSVLWLS